MSRTGRIFRKLARPLLLVPLAALLVIALVALGYGTMTVRRPWPKTGGRVQVAGS